MAYQVMEYDLKTGKLVGDYSDIVSSLSGYLPTGNDRVAVAKGLSGEDNLYGYHGSWDARQPPEWDEMDRIARERAKRHAERSLQNKYGTYEFIRDHYYDTARGYGVVVRVHDENVLVAMTALREAARQRSDLGEYYGLMLRDAEEFLSKLRAESRARDEKYFNRANKWI